MEDTTQQEVLNSLRLIALKKVGAEQWSKDRYNHDGELWRLYQNARTKGLWPMSMSGWLNSLYRLNDEEKLVMVGLVDQMENWFFYEKNCGGEHGS